MTPQTVVGSSSFTQNSLAFRRSLLACLFACAMLIACACAHAQDLAMAASPVASPSIVLADPTLAASPVVNTAAESSSNDLPEDPGTLLAGNPPQNLQLAASLTPTAPTQGPVAPIHAVQIPPGWSAQRLTNGDKLAIAFDNSISLLSVAAMLSSAGYEQALNNSPNYGTDRGAFGERLGAAAVRETSQTVLSQVVFGTILHQDPRYYEQGRGHSIVHRGLYAITRPFVTLNDDGHSTFNSSLMLGYASAAALSYAYYPPLNQNFRDTAETFAGSIGGAGLGFLVQEFSHDALEALHLAKKR